MAAVALAAVPAQAAEGDDGSAGHAVFVQNNSTDGNGIAAYRRNGDGTLRYLTTYATGGLGGREAGAGSGPLANQGPLRLVPDAHLLIAVKARRNAGPALRAEGDLPH